MPASRARDRVGRPTAPGTGVRLAWRDVPSRVREVIEDHLGGAVRKVEPRRGGFSPGFAGILTSDTGSRVFVKVGSGTPNPLVPIFYRREWKIASALPEGIPAPAALWSEDDGEWVTIAFEALRGANPRLPWRTTDLDRVLRAFEAMTDALTPAPFAAPTLREHFDEAFRGFRTLRDEDARGVTSSGRLDPWVRRHLAVLASWESRWPRLLSGGGLLHNDVRADNIVLTRDRVYFVDWPHAALGPAWADLVGFLPSVAMQGGPPPWEVFEASPFARNAAPEAVRAYVAAATGYFLRQSRLPPPPGLPTVREFQRAQGVEALRWLRRLATELR
jgi:aminoglycoside phosphotransferase (APT) family kinase protein